MIAYEELLAPGSGQVPDILSLLGDRASLARRPAFRIEPADSTTLPAYQRLRHEVFVREQGLFTGTDRDDRDDDPRTVVLVARSADGDVLGGVRLGPATGPDLGWWQGGRLAVDRRARGTGGIGAALIRAACAHAESAGVLRFEATVQARNAPLFTHLGWQRVREVRTAGVEHVLMRWPVRRVQDLVEATKAALGPMLAAVAGHPKDLGGAGFLGDDAAPVPGSDLVAACDAIVPSMVERDPAWAGWCSVLVNVNDLAAMGAEPVGLLDAIGARNSSHATRVLAGLHRAAEAYGGIPLLGGHTQLDVPAALSVTALGRTSRPIPGGGGRPGHAVRLTADLGGDWRPTYPGRQWDSTSHRRTPELRAMISSVAAAQPAAAKDVSMAGIAGTLGMLAEASGCAAVLDVADVPRPATANVGDWLTCFPGFAMLTTDEPRSTPPPAGPATTAVCGQLVPGSGVSLRWPDGELTDAVTTTVTGLGNA